jgi:hypothetical protein
MRAKDPKRHDPTPVSQFIGVERSLMELLWIFGCPVAVIVFVHRTRQVEMCFICYLISPPAVAFYGSISKVKFPSLSLEPLRN